MRIEIPPNNRLHTDSALHASADGRSGLAWFSSQCWFQSDRRAERVKRDVRQQIIKPIDLSHLKAGNLGKGDEE
jgi:hypothetical protein